LALIPLRQLVTYSSSSGAGAGTLAATGIFPGPKRFESVMPAVGVTAVGAAGVTVGAGPRPSRFLSACVSVPPEVNLRSADAVSAMITP
jgi:hypothetical protein